jgi:hypothetical protein
MGFDRTTPPSLAAQVSRWQTPYIRPCVPHVHLVRPPKRDPVADAAGGNGLWLRHDMLAALAGLAAGRNLGPDPLRTVELVIPLRRN